MMKAVWTIAAAMCLASCSSTGQMTSAQFAAQQGGAETVEGGMIVQRYPDGSGSVRTSGSSGIDGWSIACPVDAMTDRRSCSLHNLQSRILISYEQGSTPRTVCVVGHDFPGRTAQIRIDGNSPVTTNRDGCVASAALISQMKAGATVAVRYYAWPYDYPVDSSGSLAGLNEAMNIIAETTAK